MKILFVFHNVFFFRYLDGVIRDLRSRGHDVVIAVDTKRMTAGYSDRALRLCIQETGCLEEAIIQPVKWSKAGAIIRDINGYANYFRKDHPSPSWADQWKKYFSKGGQRLLNVRPLESMLHLSLSRWLLKTIERKWEPDSRILERLWKDRPDIVVACPFIWTMSADADYIKAAAKLKIPTVVAIASWDHLAGKGLFPLIPDATLVWNHDMANDAFYLQDIPEDKIVTVGSPPFDFWFDAVPTKDRGIFLSEVGLNPDYPYIVYLCSSRPIAGSSEPAVVQSLIEKLKARNDIKNLQILARPYPSMAHVWDGVEIPDVRIWPRNGDWPDTDETRQTLFNTLYYSMAVVGINTTAMIEASVLNRPSMTLMTKEFEASQNGRAHFRQMLKGGFLETAKDFKSAAEILAGLFNGNDSKEQQRLEFARNFLRPGGLDRKASFFAAQAIEMVAKGATSRQVRSAIPGQWSKTGMSVSVTRENVNQPDSCVLVDNVNFHKKCPFCGSSGIVSLGQISYAEPKIFADTRIQLTIPPELWECRVCLSRFVQYSVPEQDAEKFYSAKTSKRWTSVLPFAERRTAKLLQLVNRYLRTGLNVLDIGCSTGAFLDFAKGKGCVTHGLESSALATDIAVSMGHDCRPTIEDFGHGMLFDAVFCFDVIEHVYSVKDFINRFSAMLKPGGIFFILTGDVRCWFSKKLGSRWWYVRYPEHISFPSIKYLKRLPQFKVIDLCRTFAFQHQEGTLGIEGENRCEKMWPGSRENEYFGYASPIPDHLAVVLRKKK